MGKNKRGNFSLTQTQSFARSASASSQPDRATLALAREAVEFGMRACAKTMMNKTGMGFNELSQVKRDNAPATTEQVERILKASESLGFVAQPKVYF